MSDSIAQRRVEVRRIAVERDFVNGLTGVVDLATRHGVSPATITFDLKAIYKRWQEEGEVLNPVARLHVLRMLGEVHRLSMDGFRRSQKNKQKVRTEYRPVRCSACKGTGFEGGEESGDWCPECKGDGSFVEEITTREEAGQAGDPSFLRVANDSIREAARLRGLYPDRPKDKAGPPQLNVNIDLTKLNLDPQTILNVKRSFALAQDKVIDTVSEYVD